MGFNQFSSFSSFSPTATAAVTCDSNSKVSKTELLGAVLAGFGIWTKPAPAAKPLPTPSNVYPLRVIRVNDANPQMAGRMVISGRMADVCAELDRLAA